MAEIQLFATLLLFHPNLTNSAYSPIFCQQNEESDKKMYIIAKNFMKYLTNFLIHFKK